MDWSGRVGEGERRSSQTAKAGRDVVTGSCPPPGIGVSTERENAKKVLFNAIRPLPLKHNWTFWYDKYFLS
jgi:hypothetical protein